MGENKSRTPRSAIGLQVAGVLYVGLGLVLALMYYFVESARDGVTAVGLFATVAGLGFVALDLAARQKKEARTGATDYEQEQLGN